MGVDYYECNKCGNGFRDDSDYCLYCDCGAHFCSKECADPSFDVKEGEPECDSMECSSCCVCRNQHCTDYGLLNFLLEHFNLTREQAAALYFAKNKPISK